MTAAEELAGELPAGALPGPLLVVVVGASEFALPIERVREVLRTPPVARVPFAPAHVRGAIALRGSVLPLVDLGLRLFAVPTAGPGATVVVTDDATGATIALLVDEVPGLLDAESAHIAPAPDEAEASLPHGWMAGLVVHGAGRATALLEISAVLGLRQSEAEPPQQSTLPRSQEQG